MKKLFYITTLSILMISCKEETKKPKVSYQENSSKKEAVQKTAELIEIADLPIQFVGSNALIYAIGEVKMGANKASYDFNKSGDGGFNVSNNMDNEITGYLSNVKFQQIGQDSITKLTDKNIGIERISFIKEKKQLLYFVYDQDSNQDNQVDDDDIKTLYISEDNGKNFTKISTEKHEIIDFKYNENTNLLYYRTIDDSNKNGKFDAADKMHYFTYDFGKKVVVEQKII